MFPAQQNIWADIQDIFDKVLRNPEGSLPC
jgi:hypothetical protein